MNIDHPYVLYVLYSYYLVSNQSKTIINICWIPSNITCSKDGKNEADEAAKSALEFEIVQFKIPSTDLKHFIKLYKNSLWQIFWDFCDTSKLYPNQNKVNIPYNFNLKRSDQVVISRIRIGHLKFTHTCILKGKQLAECIFCDCQLTLHHIFLELSLIHISEPTRPLYISYAVFCLKKLAG